MNFLSQTVVNLSVLRTLLAGVCFSICLGDFCGVLLPSAFFTDLDVGSSRAPFSSTGEESIPESPNLVELDEELESLTSSARKPPRKSSINLCHSGQEIYRTSRWKKMLAGYFITASKSMQCNRNGCGANLRC
jgi:hypothetical protein